MKHKYYIFDGKRGYRAYITMTEEQERAMRWLCEFICEDDVTISEVIEEDLTIEEI